MRESGWFKNRMRQPAGFGGMPGHINQQTHTGKHDHEVGAAVTDKGKGQTLVGQCAGDNAVKQFRVCFRAQVDDQFSGIEIGGERVRHEGRGVTADKIDRADVQIRLAQRSTPEQVPAVHLSLTVSGLLSLQAVPSLAAGLLQVPVE